MERQKFTEKPKTVLDLGTGYSNVHFNISEEIDNTVDVNGNLVQPTVWIAAVVRVENPIDRDKIIAAIVNGTFSKDFREAALRKGISDKDDSDYVSFNNFVNDIKDELTKIGI